MDATAAAAAAAAAAAGCVGPPRPQGGGHPQRHRPRLRLPPALPLAGVRDGPPAPSAAAQYRGEPAALCGCDYVSISTFVCVRSFVRRSIRPSVRPSVRPYVRPSLRLSVRPSVRSFVRPFVRPSVRPSVPICPRPSVRLPVCPSIHPFVCPCICSFSCNHSLKQRNVKVTKSLNVRRSPIKTKKHKSKPASYSVINHGCSFHHKVKLRSIVRLNVANKVG